MPATISTIILDTMNALQTLHATITGVKAPQVANYPTMLDDGNTPLVVTYPGRCDTWIKGGSYNQDDRVYHILVFTEPLTQFDLPSRTVQAVTLLAQFEHLYTNPANIALANPPPYQLSLQSAPDGVKHSDEGLTPNLAFGGRPFYGFEFMVTVRAEWNP